MIRHLKEAYPGVNSNYLHIHRLSIERDGVAIASMRALGARVRDSWADRLADHPQTTFSTNQELIDLFEGMFGFHPEDFDKDILSYGLRDEVLDALDSLPGGMRAADKMDPLPNILYIDNILVNPDYRGQGLATRMIRSLKNLRSDYDAVLLEASPFLSDFDGKASEQSRLRVKLRQLYERSGFTSIAGDFPYMLATFSALSPRAQLAIDSRLQDQQPGI